MNDKKLVIELSKRLNREEIDISSLLEGLAVVFKENLCELNTIAIPGFGEFLPIKIEEQISCDEYSGKKMLYPPKICVEFKQSSLVRKKIANS